MSTTSPADIIITADTVIERARPLEDSFENNVSDHRETNATNSDIENSPILFDDADEDAVHLRNNSAVTASVPSIYCPKLMLPPVLCQTMLK